MNSADDPALQALLDEQARYYDAAAAGYDNYALHAEGAAELAEALQAFQPTGSVLELACGPGTWTRQLLSHAADLTAVDASPQMLARAAARVGDRPVRFIQADLFTWQPDRRYDVVFFGFWLSHVPPGRFAAFWSMVARCLEPGGRVFLIDDGHRTPDELVHGEQSTTIQRLLPGGSAHQIVKVPYQPAGLERQLHQLGWDITVHMTPGPFYWAAGNRR